MSFSIGKILDTVANIAEIVSPIVVGMINPAAGAALAASTNMLDAAKNQNLITGGALNALTQSINGRLL